MALYNSNTTNTTAPVEADVPVIDTASIYTSTGISDTIISHMDGASWVIDYYGQHIGADTPVVFSGDIIDATLRQYQSILKFELRVTESLTLAYNAGLGLSVLTGAANVYPVIAPIPGDLIIGSVGDEQLGIFEVATVERLSFLKESAWHITYHLINYQDDALLADIKSKVINALVFDVGLLGSQWGPLRTLSENNRSVSRDEITTDMISQYHREFYSKVEQTFMVPELEGVYDPYVVEYWNRFIKDSFVIDFPVPNEYTVANTSINYEYRTIWDVLAAQNLKMISRVVPSMRVVNVSTLDFNRLAHGLIANGIYKVIQPFYNNGVADVTLLDNTDEFSPYVLSGLWYTNDAGQSLLETLVRKAVDRTLLDYNEIYSIYETLDSLTPLERFYTIPLLITLLHISR